MPEQRRRFSPPFKAEAVHMVIETSKPIAVARDRRGTALLAVRSVAVTQRGRILEGLARVTADLHVLVPVGRIVNDGP
jgi:hypothetical protein